MGVKRETGAFSGCCVVGPDGILDVLLGVVGESCLAWQIAPENSVGVLDRAALPRRVRIAEEGRDSKITFQLLVLGELRAVVAGDGAPSGPRQAFEEAGEAGGGGLGGLARQAGGEGQAGLALDGGQKIASLGAEPHEVALPMAELIAGINGLSALMNGAAVRDRAAPAFETAPAPGRLGVSKTAFIGCWTSYSGTTIEGCEKTMLAKTSPPSNTWR